MITPNSIISQRFLNDYSISAMETNRSMVEEVDRHAKKYGEIKKKYIGLNCEIAKIRK